MENDGVELDMYLSLIEYYFLSDYALPVRLSSVNKDADIHDYIGAIDGTFIRYAAAQIP